MEISNEELFDHAMSDEQPEVTAETQVTEGQDERARDDQGRFVEKPEQAEKPEQQAKPEAKEEGQIPAWRLREIREERDELRRQLAAAQRPAPQTEKPAKPDMFEKPDEFVRQSAQEVADPINARVNSVVEFYSKRDAIKEHGQERLNEAYSALDRAANAGDPMAIATVHAVKQSMDPYGDIVAWHLRNEAANNPDAFAQRWLDERMKDEKFKGELLAKLNPSEEKPKPVINMPPNMRRVAAAAPALDDGGDLSNESLFAHATS